MSSFRTMVKKCLILAIVGVLLAVGVAADVVSTAPGWTFTDSELPSFSVDARSSSVHWTLENWRGEPLESGVWPTDGKLVLPRQPAGYYRVRCANSTGDAPTDFDFCVTAADRCRSMDSFFAADSGFSGCSRRGVYDCPWYEGDTWRVTAQLLGRCGLVHTRERLEWGNFIEPTRGRRDFSRYLHGARLLKENGVVTTGLFHDCPKWLRQSRTDRLPSDLTVLYDFMKEAARTFDPYYDAWEFWNEQELSSCGAPAWEYVAALKSFALGARAGSEKTIILPGALSAIVHGGYGQVMFDGDAAKYVQAFNLHTYVQVCGYDGWHRDVRKFLQEAGVPDWQVWLTESGTALDGNGEVDCFRKGLKRHSPAQEMLMAEFFPKSSVLHQFGGIFRNWFFLFGCYNEQGGRRDWGTMRRNGTVKPIHAAMSALTHALGDACLKGEMKMPKGVRAFLYECPDGSQTITFWSVSNLETNPGPTVRIDSENLRPVSFATGRGEYHLTDVMGTPKTVRAETDALEVTASRFPQYLSGLHGFAAEVPPTDPGRLHRYVPRVDEDLSVVIRPLIEREDFGITGGKSVAELCKEKGGFDLEVWNLSDLVKTGQVTVSTGTLEGLPERVVLPAWGKADLRVTYVPPEGDGLNFRVDFAGTFNGKAISKVCVPVFHRWRFFRSCETVGLPGLDRPEAWRRNDSGNRQSAVFDEKEKAVRFEVVWDGSTCAWFYPVHMFAAGESFKGAKYLEFEVKSWQDKVENDMVVSTVMCLYPDGQVKESPYDQPGFEWERRRVKLPDDADKVSGFRVGGLPRGHHLKYWVRNFRILKARE